MEREEKRDRMMGAIREFVDDFENDELLHPIMAVYFIAAAAMVDIDDALSMDRYDH